MRIYVKDEISYQIRLARLSRAMRKAVKEEQLERCKILIRTKIRLTAFWTNCF